MIRQAPRLSLWSSLPLRTSPARRLISTAPPPQKSRSWKSSAVRWGLAFSAIYYYNTSELFAEEPPFSIPPPQNPTDETPLPTLESTISSKRDKAQSSSPPSHEDNSNATSQPPPPADSGLEATQEEASQEGAFNEETGEINWDCPCLGGMAHGPCGEQFRAAFSCFIFSKEEPKGMDCIPNFKTMQDCFREYPEIYGAELDDEEEGDGVSAPTPAEGGDLAVAATSANSEVGTPLLPSSEMKTTPISAPSEAPDDTARAQAAKQNMEQTHGTESTDESDGLVPKAAHDATDANTGK